MPSASPTATAPAPTTTTSTAPGLLGGLGGLVSSIFNPGAGRQARRGQQARREHLAERRAEHDAGSVLLRAVAAGPHAELVRAVDEALRPGLGPVVGRLLGPDLGRGLLLGPGPGPSSAPTSVCVTPMAAKATRESLWHLDADVLTLKGMTYNGVDTIDTAGGPVNVLDFTADTVELVSMVTYADNPAAPGKRMYANGGKGRTVTLTHVHLHVLKQTGNAFGLLGLTLAPGSPDMTLIGLTEGLKLPIPVVFTGVHVDQYLLTSDTLDVPGFHAYGQP